MIILIFPKICMNKIEFEINANHKLIYYFIFIHF